MRMLEGADYNNMNLISPFFEEAVDSMCGVSKTVSVTAMFVDYANLNDFVRSRFSSPCWREAELGDLRSQIEHFRRKAKARFGQFQASGMATSK